MHKYYKILGLPPSATKQEVKKQYRKLAFKYHPDKNPSAVAQAKFVQITKAYDVIISGKLPKGERRTTSTRHTSNSGEKVYKRGNKTYTQAEFDEHLKNARQKAAFKRWKDQAEFAGIKNSKLSKAAPFIVGFYVLLGVFFLKDKGSLESTWVKVEAFERTERDGILTTDFSPNRVFSYPISNPERFIKIKSTNGYESVLVGTEPIVGDSVKITYHKYSKMIREVSIPITELDIKYKDISDVSFTYINNMNLYNLISVLVLTFFGPLLMFFFRGDNSNYYILLKAGIYVPAIAVILLLMVFVIY